MYLLWQEPNAKIALPQRIADAAAAWRAKFGTAPTVALVPDGYDGPATVAGCAVRARAWVQPSHVEVGRDE